MQRFPLLLLIILLLFGCKNTSQPDPITKLKEEVLSTEKAFALMAAQDGVAAAFLAYADDSAVMLRNDKIIKGIPAITDFFKTHDYSNVQLEWTPDFIEVSSAGDLAYTYGQYTFSLSDSIGNIESSTGIFHTVWKRQVNGNWKFVWD